MHHGEHDRATGDTEPAPSADGHLATIRAEEAAVDALERSAAGLRQLARRIVATGGLPRVPVKLRDGVAASQAGWYGVLVLGLFLAADQVLTFVFAALGPDIRVSLGLSQGSYGMIVSQRANAAVAVSLLMAAQLHRRASLRRLLVTQAALATGIGAVLSAFSASFWPLFLAVGISGPMAGVAWAVHRPMVMDGYPPPVRVRAMSVHHAGFVVGAVAAPAVVAGLSGPGGLSWRGVLLVVGTATVVVAAAGLRLHDPVTGRHDSHVVRAAVRAALGSSSGTSEAHDLRFVETVRRIWLIPTVKQLLMVWAVLGVVLTPVFAYMSFLLADRWQLTAGERSTFIAVAWAFAVPALAWFAPRGDALLHGDPARLMTVTARLLGLLAAGLLVSAVSPWIGLAVVGFGLTVAVSAVLVPALMVTMLTIVPPEARAHAGALVAVFLVAIGGQGGGLVLAGLDGRFGPAIALAVLAIPAAGAALLARRAAGTVVDDLNQLLEQVVEEEEVRAFAERGERLPLLACRHIDFAYGQLDVLFDVNFTVDDGEIVALLGTNGAGKSTLLRVISGLGFPRRGSVRYQGADITFVDAERRVGLGISQVPGGRAVFGPMTVVENLRAMGYSHGRNRRAIEDGIDASFQAFPNLAARRDGLATTLSGGEQQMLGLSTAFIVRPRLLLIDELSLGLAPKVVGELLDMLRQINQAGTAVVLVEQSVNVALSVVEHAYFMEKGQVRFDGNASDILARPDLLRSVFLEGASKGFTRAGGDRSRPALR